MTRANSKSFLTNPFTKSVQETVLTQKLPGRHGVYRLHLYFNSLINRWLLTPVDNYSLIIVIQMLNGKLKKKILSKKLFGFLFLFQVVLLTALKVSNVLVATEEMTETRVTARKTLDISSYSTLIFTFITQ